MSRPLVLTGNLLAIGTVVYVIDKLVAHHELFARLPWGFSTVIFFAVAVTYSTSVVVVGTWIWRTILTDGGTCTGFRKAFSVYGQAQLGKYLPGNVFHYIGRAALGTAYGFSLEPIVLSMGVETLITILSALLVAGIGVSGGIMPGMTVGAFFGGARLAVVLVGAASIAIAVLAMPRSRSWLVRHQGYARPKTVALTTLVNGTVFIGFGVMLSYLQGLFGTGLPPVPWWSYTVGFTVAWLAGFVVPGAPGGVGVREAAFVAIFSPVLGAGMATAQIILVRIIMTLGDLAAFGLAYRAARQGRAMTGTGTGGR